MMNKLYFYCLALFVAPTFSAFGQTQPSQDENGYYLIDLKSASNLNGNLNCSKELEHYAS